MLKVVKPCLPTAPVLLALALSAGAATPLPGTASLEESRDRAALMVAGIDRHLDRLIADTPAQRHNYWLDLPSASETNRVLLRKLLGVTDARDPVTMRYVTRVGAGLDAHPGQVATGPGYRVFAVTWNVFRGVEGEGLLLVPEGKPVASIIAVPDCDSTPEQSVGLTPGVPAEQQFPRRFAEAGCRVLIPALIDRGTRFAGNPGIRQVRHSQRETLWRAAYELGRHPLGYEIQKVLAGADWLVQSGRDGAASPEPLGVVGFGEGGLIALYAGAIDARLRTVGVCGAFGLTSRQAELPIYRNVWSLLERFGDAEVAAMIPPRTFVAEHGKYPEVVHTDEGGGAPGRLWRPSAEEWNREAARFANAADSFLSADADDVCGWETAERCFRGLTGSGGLSRMLGAAPTLTGTLEDAAERTRRQYRQILEDTQHLMRESEYARREFWQRADFSSLAAFTDSAVSYRDYFRSNVVGMIPEASLPPNPRSRLIFETNGVRGYEVVLDVHPDVFAFGILCVPAGVGASDRRPVVVCQHGLEGRPVDVSHPDVNSPYYHQYGLRLAEQGLVTFAPQNPYIGRTTFRQVLRKAQPLGLTLWSYIVRQHEVITDWLAEQPFVDPERIAFYGLSYGGKTAMRVPILVDRYCLSICSADYNEWIWKNVSARAPYSYLWTMEYDMPEWNLGNTFNYAELSWLIFPRPFMVERGHDDGVAPDEWVAFEYAKTRRHYVKMGVGDRTAIEFFDGPHSIHGVGTFAFLRHHLRWPE